MIGNISTPGGIRPVRFGAGIGAIGGYTYRQAVVNTGPVSYWRLGEASGTNAADEMGVTAGTYVGTPTLGAAGLLTGDSNTAVTLNGSSQYVQVANVISTPADLSLGVWFTTTYSAANQRLLCLGSAGGTPTGGYVFIGTTGTTLRIGSSIDGVALGVGPAINDGIRHFAVLTRVASSGLLTTYCDGVQIDQRMGTPGTYTWANNGPTIGATFQPLQWLTGTIDEPAVWNRALSAAEIVLLAAVGKGIW